MVIKDQYMNGLPVSSTMIIWEEVPENTKLYVIPNDMISDSDREVIQKCQGHYINFNNYDESVNEALNCLCNALSPIDKPGYLAPDHLDWACRYSMYMMCGNDRESNYKPIEGVNITHVYLCGFIM